jgi:hypothetical protein
VQQRKGPSVWTEEEDAKLLEARRRGLNWEEIYKQSFPHKSANACRKRHERRQEQMMNDEFRKGGKRNDEFIDAYMEMREEMWMLLAKKMNWNHNKWETLEDIVSLLKCKSVELIV